MRKGYENYEADLEKMLAFLSDYEKEEVERRTDGSFYVLSIRILNAPVKSIRFYHEFIEQQLIVTIQIGNVFNTTIELNRHLQLIEDNELKTNEDNYTNALQANIQVIKTILASNS